MKTSAKKQTSNSNSVIDEKSIEVVTDELGNQLDISKHNAAKKSKKEKDKSNMQVQRGRKNQKKDAKEVVAEIQIHQVDIYDDLEAYKRLRKRRKNRVLMRIATFVLLLIVAPILIFMCSILIDKNGEHNFFGYKFYVVISNSMEPQIMVNDCVVLKSSFSKEDLAVGNVIGYTSTSGQVVVHQIIDIITNSSGQKQYITKGVNNSDPDKLPINEDQIVGVHVATMHVLGNVLVFFRTTAGVILLIVLILLIIMAFYLAFKMSEDIKYVENPKK